MMLGVGVPEMSAIESETEETQLIGVEILLACERAVIGKFREEGLYYSLWIR
jgi:hypothetical protein